MDCLGHSMDPYFERAIHGLSKHIMTQNDTQTGIGAGQATPIGTTPQKGSSKPPAGNECPFLIGARCRRFEEEIRQISYFEYYSDMHMCIT